jgi:hypothetical protein
MARTAGARCCRSNDSEPLVIRSGLRSKEYFRPTSVQAAVGKPRPARMGD